jgi:dihydroflavonol-4-reductase
MPSAFVTGGTGFVGLNLVRELRAQGWDVTACHRASSNLRYIQRFEPRLVRADVLDLPSLLAAIPERVDVVFHLAASINFWSRRNAEQSRVNIEGTRNVVEAAIQRKAGRFLHLSSLAAWGPGDADVIDECLASKAAGHAVNYFRTKWLGEEEVRAGIQRGLSATFISPSNILGPYDPNTWARAFALLRAGRMPLVPRGAAPFCHVQAVVLATLAAVQKGGVGEQYCLAGPQATYAELFGLMSELLGRRPPRVAPNWLFHVAGALGDAASHFTGKEPDITRDLARVLTIRFDARSDKAARELGYASPPLRQMVEDTYDWLRVEHLI